MTTISHPALAPIETFSSEEATFLRRFVTNTDQPVFALINLPEVVKGALFARYSRSDKSLRRLLLDEFASDLEHAAIRMPGTSERAESLYHRVFTEFGDDSVAQLGGAHVACEGVSNVVTKLIERGRLMSYLEQSTRYIPYTSRVAGEWKYSTPPELQGELRNEYRRVMDLAFATYTDLLPQVEARLAEVHSGDAELGTDAAFRRAIRAKALDVLRGLLPAATRSNLGVFGSGQGYEHLILSLRASGNSEAEAVADLLLHELQQVIPSFVARVDRPDRGGEWVRYLEQKRVATTAAVHAAVAGSTPREAPAVWLTDFDPEGEIKVVAAALYADSTLPDHQLLEFARLMSAGERQAVLTAYVGDRTNRRHRPGRAFERTTYRFDVLGDYGAFRDLQRHRLLSLDWQALTPFHGYTVPAEIVDGPFETSWNDLMDRGARLFADIAETHPVAVASYAVPMAYRIRYYMDMNAREAMHLIELRSAEQGHDSYRRVAVEMHRLISEEAGHSAIAATMSFVNDRFGTLERLSAEVAKGG
ncbi:MAG TPA: FAD-dependent thymidylate synthase [Pseudolysinimonas sp.]|nr:FAD-dependent thymidylate synthase [Pseudolysinimonas sp.]